MEACSISHLDPWGTAADFAQCEVQPLELILVVKHPCQEDIALNLYSPTACMHGKHSAWECECLLFMHIAASHDTCRRLECHGGPRQDQNGCHLHLLAAAIGYL